MKNCIVYTRVSTDEQVLNLSLETQEKSCREYAQRKGYEVKKVFREEGVSAKSLNRPSLLKLLEYCRENKSDIDAVIVWAISRASRVTSDFLILNTTLRSLGIELDSVTEDISDTPEGKLVSTMMAAIAELDNNQRAKRTEIGIKAATEAGGWPHLAPYGYKNAKDVSGRPTLIIDEEKANRVVQLFDKYAEGNISLRELRNYAKSIGIRSRRGNPYNTQSISNMLRSKVYIGFIQSKNAPLPIKGLHQPIISRVLFSEVQKILEGRAHNYVKKNADYWPLRGFVRCNTCNKPLTGSSPKGRNKHYPRYSCIHCRSRLVKHPVSIDRDVLHGEFIKLLGTIRLDDNHLQLFRTIVLRKWKREGDNAALKKREIQDEINKLEQERSKVVEYFLAEKLTFREKQAAVQRIDDRRIDLEMQISSTKIQVIESEKIIDYAIRFMQDVSQYWNDADIRAKRAFQELIFPSGVSYDFIEGFRTAKLHSSYGYIENIVRKNDNLVGPAGFEPAANRL